MRATPEERPRGAGEMVQWTISRTRLQLGRLALLCSDKQAQANAVSLSERQTAAAPVLRSRREPFNSWSVMLGGPALVGRDSRGLTPLVPCVTVMV